MILSVDELTDGLLSKYVYEENESLQDLISSQLSYVYSQVIFLEEELGYPREELSVRVDEDDNSVDFTFLCRDEEITNDSDYDEFMENWNAREAD